VAKKKGLTGIAVTDHNTIKGGLEVRKINIDRGFSVIVGSEIQTEVGDIIGLCICEEIQSRIAVDVIKEIKDQGGFVVLPHPFRGHRLNRYVIEQSDAIEVFNSRSTPEENTQALKLAKKYDKPFTAGSDAHFASEIGNGGLIMDIDLRADLLNSLTTSQTNILRKESQYYLHDISQIIKSFKTRNLQHIPRQMLRVTYHLMCRA
jgi:hypothetical protein